MASAFKSGGGVLCIATLEFMIGLALLGVFEVQSPRPRTLDSHGVDRTRKWPALIRGVAATTIVAVRSICCGLPVQGFKSHYFRAVFGMWSEAEKSAHKDLPAAARSLNFRSPLDILFWYSVANNVCSIFGLAGVLAAQRVSLSLNTACIICHNRKLDVQFGMTLKRW